jgi:hypothetical protein
MHIDLKRQWHANISGESDGERERERERRLREGWRGEREK